MLRPNADACTNVYRGIVFGLGAWTAKTRISHQMHIRAACNSHSIMTPHKEVYAITGFAWGIESNWKNLTKHAVS